MEHTGCSAQVLISNVPEGAGGEAMGGGNTRVPASLGPIHPHQSRAWQRAGGERTHRYIMTGDRSFGDQLQSKGQVLDSAGRN